jgi:hypothetical protein
MNTGKKREKMISLILYGIAPSRRGWRLERKRRPFSF